MFSASFALHCYLFTYCTVLHVEKLITVYWMEWIYIVFVCNHFFVSFSDVWCLITSLILVRYCISWSCHTSPQIDSSRCVLKVAADAIITWVHTKQLRQYSIICNVAFLLVFWLIQSQDKMPAISQTAYSYASSWMQSYVFRSNFH